MIRRGFWLVAGAALGVTGYRRASRLLQSFRPQPAARSGPGASGRVVLRTESLLTGRRVLAGAARAGRGAAASAAFVRDVREGVAEYLEHQNSAPLGRGAAWSEERGATKERGATREGGVIRRPGGDM